jgi:hypothetical protein
MSNYLPTLDDFLTRTVMPSDSVLALEERHPGWVVSRSEIRSARIDGRLRKRYDVPFLEPHPVIVIGWCVDLVTLDAYIKLGIAPSDAQMATIAAAADRAETEIREAADAQGGLYDLPLRADTTTTGIRGGPLAYSEASPYVWRDVQYDAAVAEDENRSGTSRGAR